MTCNVCHERPKYITPSGRVRAQCRECHNARERTRSLKRYADRRGRDYRPITRPIEVPLSLRQELAGFAKELGFGR